MTAFSEIEADLDWREAELAILRILLADKAIKAREKTVIFRAAWAILYAHYEGFCKFALTVYYDAVQRSGLHCRSLSTQMRCFALKEPIRKMRGLSSSNFIAAISEFEVTYIDAKPHFPEVDTSSNLWPDRLQALLRDADLNIPSLSFHNRKLETLVRRRNKIAHGEKDIITEMDYYVQYEDAFKVVAYELAFAIDQKLIDIESSVGGLST